MIGETVWLVAVASAWNGSLPDNIVSSVDHDAHLLPIR
jgi:hypothetical protein